MNTKLFLLFLAGSIFSGCNNHLKDLEAKVQKLDADILKVREQMDFSPVAINPDQKAYSVIETKVGKLLLITENVQAYIDGYKVTLKIGNPLSADINDFGLICYTAKRDENGFVIVGSDRVIKNEVTTDLKAGAWTNVELILTPATPEEVRNALIFIEVKTMALRSSKQPSL